MGAGPLSIGGRAAVAWRWAGLAFCLMWAVAMVMFPVLKKDVLGYVPIAAGLALGAALAHPRVHGPLGERLSAISTPAFLVLTILIGLVLRLAIVWINPAVPSSDSGMYHGFAVQLVQGEGYGRTAHWAPGQPLLLAAWYLLTGPHAVAGYVLGALSGTALIPVTYDVARRALTPLAARWAAVLVAVMPTLVFTSARTDTSASLSLAVLATADLALIAMASGWKGIAAAAGAGAVLGFASLVKAVFLLAPILVVIAWFGLGLRRGLIARGALCLAVAVCVVVPWTVRNYYVLGAFVPVSSNGGFSLYNGGNPETDGLWSNFVPPPGMSEIEADRLRRTAALERMRNHPLEWLGVVVRKQGYMWGTSSTNIGDSLSDSFSVEARAVMKSAMKLAANVGWAALWVLCFRASLTAPAWGNPGLRLLVLVVFYTFAVHIFFEVQSRYHIPVIGALILVAAAGLAWQSGRAAAPARPEGAATR